MFCFENRKHVFANKTCAKIEDERHANVTNIKTSHLMPSLNPAKMAREIISSRVTGVSMAHNF